MTSALQVTHAAAIHSEHSPESHASVPDMAEAGWPPAVIAGAYQTGVLAVRALKRRGIKAVCFDANPSNPGFYSAYGPARLCPDPDTHPMEWLEFMVTLSAELGAKPVLIASSDQYVTAISRHAGELAGHYIVSPGLTLQGMLAEKDTQYALAAKHGMPMPTTVFAKGPDDVAEFANNVSFPCLVKPIHFREWLRLPHSHPLYGAKIAIAADPEELLVKYRLASDANPKVILQEIIQGNDSAKRVYLACHDARGSRIANAMLRELRCSPLGFGPASVTEPVDDDEADAICNGFLSSLSYSGICEIEVKRDMRDGIVKLIEVNPRLSGSGDAAPYAGVDLCWIHYLDLIGQRIGPITPMGNNFRHIVLRADGNAISEYRGAGLLSMRDILASYRPPLAFYDLDRHDLRYSIETLYIFLKSIIQGGIKRIRSRVLAI